MVDSNISRARLASWSFCSQLLRALLHTLHLYTSVAWHIELLLRLLVKQFIFFLLSPSLVLCANRHFRCVLYILRTHGHLALLIRLRCPGTAAGIVPSASGTTDSGSQDRAEKHGTTKKTLENTTLAV